MPTSVAAVCICIALLSFVSYADGAVGKSTNPLPVSQTSLDKLDALVTTMTNRWQLLDSECSTHSAFAITYLLMTSNARMWIRDVEYFDDGDFMADFMVQFAQRYSDAIDAWLSQTNVGSISLPWKEAFQFAATNRSSVIQDLYLGMNAHINYDLAIIVDQLQQGASRKDDYDRVNDLMECTLADVATHVGGRYDSAMSPGPLNDIVQSALLPMVIGWRDNAWLNGQLLQTSNLTMVTLTAQAQLAAAAFKVPSLTPTTSARVAYCEANHSPFVVDSECENVQ